MAGFFALWLSNLLLSFSKHYRKYIVFIFLFAFVIIIGYRDFSVGADTGSYKGIFDRILSSKVKYPEPLYRYLNYIVAWMGGSYRSLLIVCSFITLLFFYLGIRKSCNILFAFLCVFSLYYLFYAMNIIRQIIAVSIVFYGYTLLEKRKKLKFILCVITASLFHVSAVVSLIVLAIRKIKITKAKVFLGIAMSIIMGALGILTNGRIYSLFLGKYAGYLNHGNLIRTSYLAPVFLSVILTGLFIFVYASSRRGLRRSLWTKLFFLAVISNNLFIFIELGLRLSMFFSVGEVMLFPAFIRPANNRWKEKSVPVIVISVYLAGVLFILLAIKSAISNPYSNSFFMEILNQ